MVNVFRVPRVVSRLATAAALIALIAASSALAGCSDGRSDASADAGAGVASVVTPSQKSSAASSVDDARPVLRPDSSDEDWVLMYRAYYDCLVEHGVPRPDDTGALGKVRLDESNPQHKKALRTCRSKEPEKYEEREKRQDFAAYSDHNRQAIACMREHGVRIEVDSSGEWGLEFGAEGGDWMRTCVREAFVGK